MGGAALHLGNIAEMKTGEGKTLTAALPAYLNAIAGKGVHVITVNDFLASYQSELMGRVYRALGMTTGTVVSGQTPEVRREQYEADISYGTNNESASIPARQHGVAQGRPRAARPLLRHRRRGRLDPHRRGTHPAHHLGTGIR